MLYFLETNLSNNKSIFFALTKIFGIGKNKGVLICKKLGFASNLKVKNLNQKQITALFQIINFLNFPINVELKHLKFTMLKKLINIKCYRGFRKIKKFPARGQLTDSKTKSVKKIISIMINNLFIAQNLLNISKILPILKIQMYQNEISLIIKKPFLISILTFFKNHIKYQFKILTCISGVDYPSNKYRFKIVYELLSVRYNIRLRIKILTDELSPVESIESVFLAAGWYESEIWDLYGVFFINHSNLTKLLTDYGFEGHPLRKDFPLSGFIESSYNYSKKRVVNDRIELSQEYRNFKFESPWGILKLNN